MSSEISRGLKRVVDSLNQPKGELGVHYLSGTGEAPTGKYSGFYVTGTAVINTITYIDAARQSGTITALTLNTGVYVPVPGLFSNIKLTSGTMILYKA